MAMVKYKIYILDQYSLNKWRKQVIQEGFLMISKPEQYWFFGHFPIENRFEPRLGGIRMNDTGCIDEMNNVQRLIQAKLAQRIDLTRRGVVVPNWQRVQKPPSSGISAASLIILSFFLQRTRSSTIIYSCIRVYTRAALWGLVTK